ncbi:Botulinum neurotoxin type E [Labeo rohita]|uniref:Botulinum neurotoxin type E n=1 Tax=Labeo rohita TaxID=84645 RepID=A0ABQ8MZZ0_LABRO|nr:Botulinum neurotoxin type E [Labeo rohita]
MFCKEYYNNLSIVSNSEDLKMLEEAARGTYGENSCTLLNYKDTITSAVGFLLENHPFCTVTSVAVGNKNHIKSKTNNALTDSVWTGLCFLTGNWLNMINAQNNLRLPSYPPEPYCCGACNTKTERWENRDCKEKLNFLCNKK